MRQGPIAGGALPGRAGLAGADLPEHLGSRLGDKGGEQDSGDPQHLQQVVHHPGQPGAVGLHVLGQGPGGVLVDILVGPADHLEDLRQGVLEGVVLHLLFIPGAQGGDQLHQLPILLLVRRLLLRQGAAEILAHHGHGA